MKTVAWILLAFIFIFTVSIGIGWIAEGNDFFMYKFFAPKYMDAQRETFQHSRPFVEGKIEELNKMQFEYVQAPVDQKPALASLILHQASDIDQTDLTPDLRSFIQHLRDSNLTLVPTTLPIR